MELRVFLVEDLQSMQGLIADLFAFLGQVRLVGMTATEAEAKLWLNDHPGDWDILIADLVLQEGSGIEVIRHAKQFAAGRKIVVFSSFASPGVRAHCLRLGADAVFDKTETQAFIAWLHAQSTTGHSSPGDLSEEG